MFVNPQGGPPVEPPVVPAPAASEGSTLLRVLGDVGAVACLAGALWCLALGLVRTCGLLLILAGSFRMRTRGLWYLRSLRVALFGVTALTAVVFRHVPFLEYVERQDRLVQQVLERGPAGLDLRDVIGVFGLQATMAAASVPCGRPDSGVELTRMLVPFGRIRKRDADFPMRSAQVRQLLREYTVLLQSDHKDDLEADLPATPIHWEPTDGIDPTLPVLLPVTSPLLISGFALRTQARWELHLNAAGRVSWERRARHVLPGTLRGRTLVLDETLFHALEQRGILHGFDAVWSWVVSTDDPRLTLPDRPVKNLAEAIANVCWSLWIREGALSTFWRETFRRPTAPAGETLPTAPTALPPAAGGGSEAPGGTGGAGNTGSVPASTTGPEAAPPQAPTPQAPTPPPPAPSIRPSGEPVPAGPGPLM